MAAKKKVSAKKIVKKVVAKKKPAAKKAAVKKPVSKAATAKKNVTFTYNAPNAGTVTVVGTFNNWDAAKGAMKKDKSGVWKKTAILAPGEYEYKFMVDGHWTIDPACAETMPNEHGTLNSLLRVG